MLVTNEDKYNAVMECLEDLAGIDLPASMTTPPWPEVQQAREHAERAESLFNEALQAHSKARGDARQALKAWIEGKGKLDAVVRARSKAASLDMSRDVVGGREVIGEFRKVFREEVKAVYGQAVDALTSIGEEQWVAWLDAMVDALADKIRGRIDAGMVSRLRWGRMNRQQQDWLENELMLSGFPEVVRWYENICEVWSAAYSLREYGVIPGRLNSEGAMVGALTPELASTLRFEWESLDGIYSDYRRRFIERGRCDEFLACLILRGQRPGVYTEEEALSEAHSKVVNGWGGDWDEERREPEPEPQPREKYVAPDFARGGGNAIVYA